MELDEISLSELQQTAHTYRKDFVALPIIGLERSTRFMTVKPGIRGKDTVFSPDFNAQLAPYANAERKKAEGSMRPRTIETFFGAAFFDFDPNQIISSIFGHRASQAGEGKKSLPTSHDVCSSVAKNIGKDLNLHLFDAKRDDEGKTTKDLFDGFDTITDREIEKGNISEEKGNLIILKEKITNQNADAVLKKCLFAASDELREEEAFIYCSRAITDAYNENYLLTHQSLNYNTEYNQPKLEGSDGNWVFAPMAGKRKSKYIHISTKGNMNVGCDQMSDTERFEINKYEPKALTGEMYMFIGTQMESIDPRRLLVIKLPDDEPAAGGAGVAAGGDDSKKDSDEQPGGNG